MIKKNNFNYNIFQNLLNAYHCLKSKTMKSRKEKRKQKQKQKQMEKFNNNRITWITQFYSKKTNF